MPGTSTPSRLVPRQRSGPLAAVDPLDEFATEQGMPVTRLPPTPRAALARRGLAGPASKPKPKPGLVVRIQLPMTRHGVVFVAAGLTTSGLAALVGAFLFVTRDGALVPQAFLIPSPSPIEIEYPDYPGAPALRAASAAVPGTLVAEQVALSIDGAATIAIGNPRGRTPETPRGVPSSVPVALATASPFAVRSAVPQLVAASAGDAGPAARPDDSRSADAPPRRLGPPLALTALGGTATRNGRLALVLDVTEQGDVARVVSHEAVDVHPDVLDSVTTSARGWRYEPARREGVAVPARVRVVVQLSGGQ